MDVQEYREVVIKSTECPFCKAKRGEVCVEALGTDGPYPLTYVHDDRSAAHLSGEPLTDDEVVQRVERFTNELLKPGYVFRMGRAKSFRKDPMGVGAIKSMINAAREIDKIVRGYRGGAIEVGVKQVRLPHAYVESGSGFCAVCDDMIGEGEHA